MLSFDRSEPRADHRPDPRRRPAPGAYGDALGDDAQPFDPDAPWDDAAAEALTSLYESEEGRLSRPATAGERMRAARAKGRAETGSIEAQDSHGEGLDRAWLETQLSQMAQQLKDAVAEANPQPTLAALSGRLETIEQRFGATLGRVAQRTDLDALRAIETRVLDLAAQLDQARERLDRIGSVDAELSALARKVEETSAQRNSGLEKLLRDLAAEWREGEQRTTSALQHIEESIGRLSEAVDAMEASKPAPDLTVPPLTGVELSQGAGPVVGRTVGPSLDQAAPAGGAFRPAEVGRPSQSARYQATLDAADYAPKPFAADPFAPASGAIALPDGREAGKPAGARLSPGAVRIMALRAKLRQSAGGGIFSAYRPVGEDGERRGMVKRASLSVLIMAGAALATSSYYLYRAFAGTASAGAAVVAEEGSKAIRW